MRGRVQNPATPGFETGCYGAETETLGNYRQPNYVERVRQLADTLHRAGAVITGQLTRDRRRPAVAEASLSSPLFNNLPHVMSRDYIRWYVRSTASARPSPQGRPRRHRAATSNHDDMLEWFLSPYTNDCDDE